MSIFYSNKIENLVVKWTQTEDSEKGTSVLFYAVHSIINVNCIKWPLVNVIDSKLC